MKMSKTKLIQLDPLKTDVKEVLADAMEWADGMKCIMVVGINKDGQQVLRTSTMNGYEKAFLVQFLNAYMTQWFNLEEG